MEGIMDNSRENNNEVLSLKEFHTLLNNTESIPSSDTEIVRTFIDSLKKYIGSEKFNFLTEKGTEKALDETFLKQLALIISIVDKSYSKDLTEEGVVIGDIRKWCYTPDLIEKFKTANCSGSASMTTAFLRGLGVKAYFATPIGHAVTFVQTDNNEWFYIDSRNNVVEKMDIEEIAFDEKTKLNLIKLKRTISDYKLIPFYTSLQDGIYKTVKGNHACLEKEAGEGEKAAILAKKTLGQNFFREMEYPEATEMQKLYYSSLWTEERKRHDKTSHIEDALENFAESLGNENSMNILKITSESEEKLNELIEIFQKSTDLLTAELQNTDEVFGIKKDQFLEAHRSFWLSVKPNLFRNFATTITKILRKAAKNGKR